MTDFRLRLAAVGLLLAAIIFLPQARAQYNGGPLLSRLTQGSGSCTTAAANASLLWHLDSNFNDSSISGNNGTANGGAAINASSYVTPKFGTGSAKLPTASSSYALSGASISLGSGNWTFDAWVYPNTLPASGVGIMSIGIDASGISMRSGADGTPGSIYVYWAGAAPYTGGATPLLTTGSWQHLAFTRSGSNFYVFVNGTMVSTSPKTISTGATANQALGIGNNSSLEWGYFDGNVDEVHVIVGTALWTSNFTPPTLPWCN